MSLLGLPPISSPLKSISPYLQRAHELRSQDPIMAYWCAYYAAQVGISLKAKDAASRDVLFALLGTLERLKKEIGANDAVDIESVSSAYVENFALKVFAMADNEDRKGAATRSTAKKFLAAANFLEVLKTFPKSEVSESNEEKIRYSKWKAAEIAKAFREGRKPTPGPAGSDLQQDADLTPPASPPPSTKPIPIGRSSPNRASGSGSSPPSVKRASPPTHVDIPRSNQAPFAPQPQTPPRSTVSHLDVEGHARLGVWGGEGEATPGSWSTAATPGTAYGPSDDWADQGSPTRATIEKRDQNLRSGSGSSFGSGGSGGNGSNGGLKQNKAWVSDEIDSDAANQHYTLHGNGGTPDSAGTTGSDGSSKKSVHFTPSVVGGLSDSSVSNSSVPTSPSYEERNYEGGGWPTNQPPPVLYGGLPPPVPGAIDMSILPPGFVPDPHHFLPTEVAPPPTTLISPSSPPNTNYYPSPQPPAPVPLAQNFYAAPPPPQLNNIPTPLPVFELTPSVIAKAQKHCRFAISSLDYEDAEQARKELRAALAILGG